MKNGHSNGAHLICVRIKLLSVSMVLTTEPDIWKAHMQFKLQFYFIINSLATSCPNVIYY